MADYDQQILLTYRSAFDFALAGLIDTLKEAQEYLSEGYDLAAIGTMTMFDDRSEDMKAALRLFRPVCQGRRCP